MAGPRHPTTAALQEWATEHGFEASGSTELFLEGAPAQKPSMTSRRRGLHRAPQLRAGGGRFSPAHPFKARCPPCRRFLFSSSAGLGEEEASVYLSAIMRRRCWPWTWGSSYAVALQAFMPQPWEGPRFWRGVRRPLLAAPGQRTRCRRRLWGRVGTHR